ncbi:FG-GAP repeat protein [Geminisphaera colitermitum]|uniref:FG-GAP repeat protein n=1 Tax=Geminisphaera colitermitum TaxID=1148786 RepID=UPI001E482E38|nr:FG-GAP repeat protein [Geminisphaera colitermitum]
MKKPIQTRSAVRTLRLAFLASGASGALAFAFLALAAPHARASTLTASDGAANDYFGYSVSVSGGGALAGAYGDDDLGNMSGSVWYFKGLDGKSGTVNEDVKLLASDGKMNGYFGESVSLSGDRALVGAWGDRNYYGAAYYYKGLDGKSGTVNESVKLLASDNAYNDLFGRSVSLSGDRALVGAYYDDDKGGDSGSVYYYKGLDNATGPTVNQDVKLLASDGAAADYFGYAVSLSGDSALVGANQDDDKGTDSGAVYYYKGLDGKSGTVNQDVKLIASDGAASDQFGRSVSLSGDSALVGAYQDDDKGTDSGSVYYYKGLDGKTGRPSGYTGVASVTTATYQDVKLLASDGAASDYFGYAVSLSGDSALVGASVGDGNVADTGAAYYFKGLDGKSGTVNESVKLLASDGAATDRFGISVSMEEDRFVIGARYAQVNGVATGKAYAGDIRAFTTLDAGGTALATDGLSFVSQGDWIIGATTSGNEVTLSRVWNTTLVTDAFVSDTANVTATGKAVYIGQNAGANDNVLIIEGTLVAREVNIGFEDQTTGNTLRLTTAALATLDIDTLFLGAGNFIEVEGSGHALADVLTLLTGTAFSAWDGAGYTLVDTGNIDALLTFVDLGNGYTQWTTIATSSVPEPATYAALAGLALLAYVIVRRRR